MIKAVVFDMDGLLIDSENMYNKHAQIVLPQMGYEYNKALIDNCIGRSRREVEQLVTDHYGNGIDVQALYINIEQSISHDYKTNGIPIKKGVFELMDFLKDKNIPIAVASSSYRKVAEHVLGKTGILPYVVTDVYGDEVKDSKPDPAIYAKACEQLGLAPNECMALEDSYNGLNAAKSAGLYTIMVPDQLPPTAEILEKIDDCVSSLLEIIPIITQLTGKV